ncbi:hypothetical protein LTR60_002532, partial [Cryomyces antarcticus]
LLLHAPTAGPATESGYVDTGRNMTSLRYVGSDHPSPPTATKPNHPTNRPSCLHTTMSRGSTSKDLNGFCVLQHESLNGRYLNSSAALESRDPGSRPSTRSLRRGPIVAWNCDVGWGKPKGGLRSRNAYK